MNRRKICTVIGCFFAITVLSNAVNAQSTRMDNPTPLTSNEISGVIDKNTKGNTYYYSFWANPGEVKVTLTIEPNLNIENWGLTNAEFVLYDSNSEVMAKKSATYLSSLAQRLVAEAKVQIPKRQSLVLGIKLPGGMYFDGVGKYKVQIDGSVELDRKEVDLNDVLVQSLEGDDNKNGKCLPKQGTLIIKMKDGSKKTIDLSKAETITVVP